MEDITNNKLEFNNLAVTVPQRMVSSILYQRLVILNVLWSSHKVWSIICQIASLKLISSARVPTTAVRPLTGAMGNKKHHFPSNGEQ